MYDPNEAKKSYLSLFKDNGASAAVQSGIFVVSWYLFNKYIGMVQKVRFLMNTGREKSCQAVL